MRACNIPWQAFYKIHAICNGEISSTKLDDGHYFEVMHLPQYEVMVGCMSGKENNGVFSFLNIWRFFHSHNLQEKYFQAMFRSNPDLQVVGGPFAGTEYTKKRGFSITETVKIVFGFELYRKGIAFDDPFLTFIARIPKLVRKAIGERPIMRHTYWQALGNREFLQ